MTHGKFLIELRRLRLGSDKTGGKFLICHLSTCSHRHCQLQSFYHYKTLEPQQSFLSLPYQYLASYIFNTTSGLCSLGMKKSH